MMLSLTFKMFMYKYIYLNELDKNATFQMSHVEIQTFQKIRYKANYLMS